MGWKDDENNEEFEEPGFDTPWRSVIKKPWDVEDDVPVTREPKKKKNQTVEPPQRIVTGNAIQEVDHTAGAENEKILETLNQVNKENLELGEERIRLQQQKEEEEAEEYRKREREKVYLERYEREQKEKEERERREAEEEAERQRLIEEKRKNNIFFRLGSSIGNQIAQKKEEKQKMREEAARRLEEKAEGEKEMPEEKKKNKNHAQDLAPEVQEPITKKESEKKIKEKPTKPSPAPERRKKPAVAVPPSPDKTDYKYIATHDSITGLMNKIALEEASGSLPYRQTGVVYVFIPDFEVIKGKGDEAEHAVLQNLANLMEGNYGKYVYHLGNGVFVALVKGEGIENSVLIAQSFKGNIPGASYSTFAGGSRVTGALADAIEGAKQEALSKKNELAAKENKGKGGSSGKTLDYDSLLTKDQRALKEQVKENHTSVSRDKTKNIIGEIKARAPEIIAIMMTDKDFNTLFIIRDVRTFISLVSDNDFRLDYSYLYVLYEGGPQYFGNDEYYSKITQLFDDISEGIRTGRTKNSKDIQKIKGINMFQKIYFE